MRFGTFPESYCPRSHLRDNEAPLVDRAVTRRGWFLGLAAFGAGVATHKLAFPAGGVGATAETPGERGSVEWALRLVRESPEEALLFAGDLERVSMRYHHDGRLIACYLTLADLALASTRDDADEAGASAVRSLARLGDADALDGLVVRLDERGDRPRMQDALGAARRNLRRLPGGR